MKSINIVYVKKPYDNLMEINFMLAKQADKSKEEDGIFLGKRKFK